MQLQPSSVVVFGAIAAAFAATSAQAVIVGQVDTFTSGTQGWATGVSGNPVVFPSGGPAGAGDAYLQLTSDGSGSSGRLIEFNRSQWLGDYVAAGVTGVGVDLLNTGSTSLSIRIALKDSQGISASGYATTTGFVLPNDGLWHHAIFGLSAVDLTAIGTPAALASFLTAPQEFRILNSVAPALNGDNIVGKMAIDNVTALPAPGGVAAAGAVALAIGVRRRRRIG